MIVPRCGKLKNQGQEEDSIAHLLRNASPSKNKGLLSLPFDLQWMGSKTLNGRSGPERLFPVRRSAGGNAHPQTTENESRDLQAVFC
jgi:hypothetical protein